MVTPCQVYIHLLPGSLPPGIHIVREGRIHILDTLSKLLCTILMIITTFRHLEGWGKHYLSLWCVPVLLWVVIGVFPVLLFPSLEKLSCVAYSAVAEHLPLMLRQWHLTLDRQTSSQVTRYSTNLHTAIIAVSSSWGLVKDQQKYDFSSCLIMWLVAWMWVVQWNLHQVTTSGPRKI